MNVQKSPSVYTTAQGLPAIYDANSSILVLGTIPAEKSREKNAYYSNNGNKFWRVICDNLGVVVPSAYVDRIDLLKQEGIALWDLIESCEIEGSKDSSIKNPKFNDLSDLLNKTKIQLIILNGQKAHKYYKKNFNDLPVDYVVASSTSGANRRFNEDLWKVALLHRSVPISKTMKHIQLCGNNRFYKIEATPKKTYVFDDALLQSACNATGLAAQHNDALKTALVALVDKKWHLC